MSRTPWEQGSRTSARSIQTTRALDSVVAPKQSTKVASRVTRLTVASLLALVHVFGCSTPQSTGERSDVLQPDRPPEHCVAGMSIGCACRTGKVGAQVCLSDGTYGACVCEREMRDADVDTSDVPSLDQIEVEDDAHMSTPLDATPHPDVTDASITADAADSAGVADILDADDSPPSVDGAVDAPSDAPEVTACPIGQHACADICVDDTTPLACGARCERCGAPANAAPTCERGICSFACAAGFHACGGACSDDASVLTCGSSCTPCPSPPANASVTCWLGACGFSCNAGYVLIGGACTPAPPRPIAPLSTSTVTSRRPTFRWSLPVGLEGARVDICTNRAMTTGCLAPIDAT